MMRVQTALLAAAIATLLQLACSEADESREDADAADASRIAIDADDAELLERLGYVDFGDEPSEVTGVTLRDADRSAPGYNLVSYPALRLAELIDAEGRVVRSWSSDDSGTRWERSHLAKDGDLLVISRPGGLARIAPDGSLRWMSDEPVHHSAVELPDGRIATLTSRERDLAGFSKRDVVDNGVALFSADGELIEEVSLYDANQRSAQGLALRDPKNISRNKRHMPLDVFHANRLQWLTRTPATQDDAFRAGRLLVTVRHQDAIVLLDWESEEIVWSWGHGILGHPHDATVLDDGHVLIFDNEGLGDGSRILEIDPATREIVWFYEAEVHDDFLSTSRGTVQRLSGGTTLIGESNRGRAFEVTPTQEIVWEYRTPHLDDVGRPAAFRIERFSEEFVAPVLRAAASTPLRTQRRATSPQTVPPTRPEASGAPNPIPEPGALGLGVAVLAALGALRRRARIADGPR